jgi:hypothetical protein
VRRGPAPPDAIAGQPSPHRHDRSEQLPRVVSCGMLLRTRRKCYHHCWPATPRGGEEKVKKIYVIFFFKKCWNILKNLDNYFNKNFGEKVLKK